MSAEVNGELSFLLGRTITGVSGEVEKSDGESKTVADLTLVFDDGSYVVIEPASDEGALFVTVSDD